MKTKINVKKITQIQNNICSGSKNKIQESTCENEVVEDKKDQTEFRAREVIDENNLPMEPQGKGNLSNYYNKVKKKLDELNYVKENYRYAEILKAMITILGLADTEDNINVENAFLSETLVSADLICEDSPIPRSNK